MRKKREFPQAARRTSAVVSLAVALEDYFQGDREDGRALGVFASAL
jgi:hypothetical protein